MKTNQKEVVLEQSTNTHKATSETGISVVKKFENGDIAFESKGAIVTHGEHGPIATTGKVAKINQQEYNPVQRTMQAAYD